MRKKFTARDLTVVTGPTAESVLSINERRNRLRVAVQDYLRIDYIMH